MVRRQPQETAVMLEGLHLANTVVPNVQHPTQPMPRPDSVTGTHLLDRHGPVLGLHRGSLGHAPVTSGAEAFDVVGGVGAEQLGLGAVGPLGERAARGRPEHHARVMCA